MALDTVTDYVTASRILLQDQVQTFRYPDSDLVLALNEAILEANRIRPDLFMGLGSVPSYAANDTTPVTIDPLYRVAFPFYMCGWAQLRDEEYTQDSRAAAFMGMFTHTLTALG